MQRRAKQQRQLEMDLLQQEQLQLVNQAEFVRWNMEKAAKAELTKVKRLKQEEAEKAKLNATVKKAAKAKSNFKQREAAWQAV